MRVLDGMYRAVAGLATAGNNVVLDDVVWDHRVAELAVNALQTIDAPIVHVQCEMATSVARERARPDRFNGAVVAYANGPRAVDSFDVAVDTTSRAPSECATVILEHWRHTRHGTAMERLRR